MGPVGAWQWPDGVPRDTTVIVDDLTPEVASMLSRAGAPSVLFLSAAEGNPDAAWHKLSLVEGDDPLGVHVPVNPLAERHRHHGFGFTDYLLVLSDRSGAHAEPPAAAAWLSAAFGDIDVVVVVDAVAWAWKGRALRGKVTVDTRMDLWRLLAHANSCVDLAPGAHIARECVEAMRLGTPIIVPAGSGPAEVHARATGGATFSDEAELLRGAAALLAEPRRADAAVSARRYADERYGDPVGLVGRVGTLLEQDRPPPRDAPAIH
ncbi:MAG TPA: hypothetical protein VHX67_02360 [Acidimicrobiales bacterium]|jgi:hypothetical protein|nr:hypothetical protein [Acidimicrobiales bacterium]